MDSVIHFLRTKKLYAIIAIIILLFFLLRTVLLQQPNTDLTYTVKQEDLVDTVQVSGTYTIASQVAVTSPTNGIIDQLFITNGQEVKKNSSLFHVQSTATVDQQKAAYVSYLAANSALQADNANLYSLQSTMFADWKKFTDLATNSTYQNSDDSPNYTNRVLPEFTTAQDNWLAAEANYKNQQAVLAKDQATVASTLQSYNETKSVTVTAPASGSVVNLLVKVGDQVSVPTPLDLSGMTISSANTQPVLLIANLQDPYIVADISEDYAARVANGQKASIVFDAQKQKTYTGFIEAIATVGTNTDGVVTYPTRIIVNNVPSSIKSSMTALITIETLRKNNIIDVPNSAIVKKNNTDYIEEAETHTFIAVLLGTQGVSKTEIIHGLSAGTVIVANPNL